MTSRSAETLTGTRSGRPERAGRVFSAARSGRCRGESLGEVRRRARGRSRLAAARPVVADRPDQPEADEHRHQQAHDGDLVGAVAERVEQQEDDSAVEQLADDLRALADQAVQPEELADPVRWREPDHEHAVGDLDAAQARCRGSRRRPGRPAARTARSRAPRTPSTRPTAHDTSTHDQRPLGAVLVRELAPHEAHHDRDQRQHQQRRRSRSPRSGPSPSRDHAHHHDDAC